MKILFLTPRLPYPPHSGGLRKTWETIRHLQSRHEVVVATMVDPRAGSNVEEFRGRTRLAGFHSVAHDWKRSLSRLVASHWRRVPLSVQRNWSSRLALALSGEWERADRIVADHFLMAQYVDPRFDHKFVLHQHNAEYVMWRRLSTTHPSAPVRLFLAWESRRIEAYERKICRRARRVIASPNDIEMLAKIGCDRARMRETFHLGDPRQAELPDIEFGRTEPKVFYAGSLRWEANVDGLVWFLEKVWPIVRSQRRDLRLEIAGGDPDRRLVDAVAATEGACLLGFVEDLETVQGNARLAIAPLRFGSGIKVKVMDAMARGLPMVTTSIGIEGLDVSNGTHIHWADNPEEFAAKMVRLSTVEEEWTGIRDSSRELSRIRYSWTSVLAKFEETLHE